MSRVAKNSNSPKAELEIRLGRLPGDILKQGQLAPESVIKDLLALPTLTVLQIHD
jgi:hypothetical protein